MSDSYRANQLSWNVKQKIIKKHCDNHYHMKLEKHENKTYYSFCFNVPIEHVNNRKAFINDIKTIFIPVILKRVEFMQNNKLKLYKSILENKTPFNLVNITENMNKLAYFKNNTTDNIEQVLAYDFYSYDNVIISDENIKEYKSLTNNHDYCLHPSSFIIIHKNSSKIDFIKAYKQYNVYSHNVSIMMNLYGNVNKWTDDYETVDSDYYKTTGYHIYNVFIKSKTVEFIMEISYDDYNDEDVHLINEQYDEVYKSIPKNRARIKKKLNPYAKISKTETLYDYDNKNKQKHKRNDSRQVKTRLNIIRNNYNNVSNDVDMMDY